MKLFLLAFLTNIVLTVTAQPPWRAKLFVHFLDSNNQITTDTVWFGCDSLGGEGYQSGLDLIDTIILNNKAYSTDALIQSQLNTDCANLKKNITRFNINRINPQTKFQFYTTGSPLSMSWDTADFIYRIDSIYRIGGVTINVQNGYIHGIDSREYLLGGDQYKKINNQYLYNGFSFKPDSVALHPESSISKCEKSGFSLAFEVSIYSGWYQFTGIKDILRQGEINIYPNPANNFVNVKLPTGVEASEIRIIDITGRLVQSYHKDHSTGIIGLDIQLANGTYFIEIINGTQTIARRKIMIAK